MDMSKPTVADSQEVVTLDLKIFSINTIKKTCYKFSSQFSTRLESVCDQKINIYFSFASINNEEVKQGLIHQFQKELIDQDLREIVFKETEAVRNLILAHAFSKTPLVESE